MIVGIRTMKLAAIAGTVSMSQYNTPPRLGGLSMVN